MSLKFGAISRQQLYVTSYSGKNLFVKQPRNATGWQRVWNFQIGRDGQELGDPTGNNKAHIPICPYHMPQANRFATPAFNISYRKQKDLIRMDDLNRLIDRLNSFVYVWNAEYNDIKNYGITSKARIRLRDFTSYVNVDNVEPDEKRGVTIKEIQTNTLFKNFKKLYIRVLYGDSTTKATMTTKMNTVGILNTDIVVGDLNLVHLPKYFNKLGTETDSNINYKSVQNMLEPHKFQFTHATNNKVKILDENDIEKSSIDINKTYELIYHDVDKDGSKPVNRIIMFKVIPEPVSYTGGTDYPSYNQYSYQGYLPFPKFGDDDTGTVGNGNSNGNTNPNFKTVIGTGPNIVIPTTNSSSIQDQIYYVFNEQEPDPDPILPTPGNPNPVQPEKPIQLKNPRIWIDIMNSSDKPTLLNTDSVIKIKAYFDNTEASDYPIDIYFNLDIDELAEHDVTDSNEVEWDEDYRLSPYKITIPAGFTSSIITIPNPYYDTSIFKKDIKKCWLVLSGIDAGKDIGKLTTNDIIEISVFPVKIVTSVKMEIPLLRENVTSDIVVYLENSTLTSQTTDLTITFKDNQYDIEHDVVIPGGTMYGSFSFTPKPISEKSSVGFTVTKVSAHTYEQLNSTITYAQSNVAVASGSVVIEGGEIRSLIINNPKKLPIIKAINWTQTRDSIDLCIEALSSLSQVSFSGLQDTDTMYKINDFKQQHAKQTNNYNKDDPDTNFYNYQIKNDTGNATIIKVDFYNTLVDAYKLLINSCICNCDCKCNVNCSCNTNCGCNYSG